jgi:hypothetical protein
MLKSAMGKKKRNKLKARQETTTPPTIKAFGGKSGLSVRINGIMAHKNPIKSAGKNGKRKNLLR